MKLIVAATIYLFIYLFKTIYNKSFNDKSCSVTM